MSRVNSDGGAGRLPTPATRFVGRRGDLTDLRRLIGENRLVTVIGVGGVGKTRLALEVAQRARRAFSGGVWFVDLATVTDAALAPHAVVAALGLLESSARPPIDQLVDHLSRQQTLIILDNCEHVLLPIATLVDGLLRRTRNVRMLATSRHVLTVQGEHLFALGPLPVPDPTVTAGATSTNQYDAVRLLVDRVTAIEPSFAVTDDNADAVARLCAQLDGLPLAIELAATRLRTLTPEQVVHRLARRFALLTGGVFTAQPRQQTLRSMVDWSYSLCTPRERLLWARLSIFTGAFDLAAAEGVCADKDLPVESITDVIDRLAAQSIITVDPDDRTIRLRMLETIRQYGRERLAEHSQEAVMRRRHQDYYLAMAEQAASRWCGPQQAANLARLRLHHGNLQAAIEAGLADGDPRPALRLVTALRYHWCADGYLGLGRHWLDETLRHPWPADSLHAQALWVGAWVCLLQGDEPAAVQYMVACQRLAERINDTRALAFATSLRGTAALFRGDLAHAAERFDAAIALFDRNGDLDGQLWALFQLAITLSHLGRHDRATEICHRSLRISEEHGEQLIRSYALWVLGYDTWRRGDLSGANNRVRDALAVQLSFNDPVGAALMIELLAWIAASEEAVEVAAARMALAESLWTSIGTTIMVFGPPLGVHHDSCVARVHRARPSRPAAALPVRSLTGVSDIIKHVLDGVPAGEIPSTPATAPAEEHGTPPRLDASGLTPREQAVAVLVSQGLTNRDIAASLIISPRTVDGHMERILAKLNFNSRAQLAVWVTAHRA